MGHGAKPPGYYVQHSYGLFLAPWPQNAPNLSSVSRLMELMGMFVAKCIQDGRRVDLPLSAPFFKLMCVRGGNEDIGGSEGGRDLLMEGDRALSPTTSPTFPLNLVGNQTRDLVSDNDTDDRESNRTSEQMSNQRSGSSLFGSENETNSAASRQRSQLGSSEAGLKEAELLLVDEISKDGSPKVSVSTEGTEGRAWFEGVLKREDMEEVDPYRSRFLKQLSVLVKQRDEIQRNPELSSLEKERLLAGLTLPGSEENIPGAKVEDLW